MMMKRSKPFYCLCANSYLTTGLERDERLRRISGRGLTGRSPADDMTKKKKKANSKKIKAVAWESAWTAEWSSDLHQASWRF